jgi:OOP family OmpA-OmpF porin
MKNVKLVWTLLTTMLLTAAFAANSQVQDDEGYYAGISANWVNADFKDRSDTDFDDSDAAFGIRGGYMFSDMLGVEIGYMDFGDFEATDDDANDTIDLNADAFTLAAVFNWSVAEYIDLYGKLGVYNVNANRTSTIAGNVLEDDDDTSAYGTLGIEYDFGDWDVFAEISIADTDINDLNMDIISVGVKYQFGNY